MPQSQPGNKAAKIETVRPNIIPHIASLLAAGTSYKEVMRQTRVSYQTIARLERDHAKTFEEWRAKAARKAQETAQVALERIMERLSAEDQDGVNLRDLTIGYGILADKSLVLADQPTAVVEHRSGLSIEAARSAIEAARKQIDAEVIDVDGDTQRDG